MSMRENAVYDYGLLLTLNTMKALAKKNCEDFTEEDFVVNEYAFYEAVEDIFGGDIEWISEFTGEARYIEDSGSDEWGSQTEYFDGDYIYYVPINRMVSLFKAPYRDMNDMISDFKERIGKYMPEDFDYRANLRHIIGTYWG